MTNAEIERIIIETLLELQAGSGEAPCEITPATSPLGDLGFFDSLLAIETTLALEQRVGCSCEDDSVFIDKETAKVLTIAEVAKRLTQMPKRAA
jgi:acyl carrier protein